MCLLVSNAAATAAKLFKKLRRKLPLKMVKKLHIPLVNILNFEQLDVIIFTITDQVRAHFNIMSFFKEICLW